MTIPKNYSYNRSIDRFVVKKKGIYYGYYKTEEDAKKAVELFRENEWDKARLWEVKNRIRNSKS